MPSPSALPTSAPPPTRLSRRGRLALVVVGLVALNKAKP